MIRHPARDRLREYLQEHGISTEIHYPIPCHLQEAYSDLGYVKGELLVAEKVANKILSLPIYPELGDEQVDYIIDTINTFNIE